MIESYRDRRRVNSVSQGSFRIVFGLALCWAISRTSSPTTPRELQRHLGFPDLAVIHTIAASTDALHWIEGAALLGAALFTIGLFTRTAYAATVLCLTALALAVLERGGAHDLGLPLITMVGWLTVRWGDSLSLDRLWSPANSSDDDTEGFALWWPGFTLGIALASAAYAKLSLSGLAWITSGAVRYHFVSDAHRAPVSWGLWIAIHPVAAVIASVGAIALEAGIILLVFRPRIIPRLVALAAAGALFTGLYLFQGINWPLWLILLLALLPWSWIDRPWTRDYELRLTAAQRLAVAALVAIQSIAAFCRIEAEPFVSSFPMYSGTFTSPTDYNARMNWGTTRVELVTADGQDITALARTLDDDQQIDLVRLAESLQPTGRSGLGVLCTKFAARAPLPREVTLVVSRAGFDWEAGRFRTTYAPVHTVPVPLAATCAAR